MNAFYFLAMTNLQDLMPVLMQHLVESKPCWVCFFDCLRKKRQFYFYQKKELVDFIENICLKNNLPVPLIDYLWQFEMCEVLYGRKK